MDVVSLLHLCKLLSMCKKTQAVLVAWAITHETTPYKWIVVSEEILTASLSRVLDRNVVQGEEDPALSLNKDLHADQLPGTGTSV